MSGLQTLFYVISVLPSSEVLETTDISNLNCTFYQDVVEVSRANVILF